MKSKGINRIECKKKIQIKPILYVNAKRAKKKEEKVMTYENTNRVFKGKQKVLNGFESKIFAIKATQGIELERLNPKKMLQRLIIALAQVRTIHLKAY